MQPLTQALAPWHDFYTLLGAASATMVGLLFVAASVVWYFSQNRRGALRIFLSASVVQFGNILAVCLIVMAPLPRWEQFGGLVTACGLFGLGYSGLAWRDTVHDGLSARIDLEDRIWYVVLPAVQDVARESASGVALALRSAVGCAALAVSAGVLLAVAMHNAWGITVWSITQRRQPKSAAAG